MEIERYSRIFIQSHTKFQNILTHSSLLEKSKFSMKSQSSSKYTYWYAIIGDFDRVKKKEICVKKSPKYHQHPKKWFVILASDPTIRIPLSSRRRYLQ